jgi:tetratricopeptide (TPR) repeat protein
LFLSVRFGWHPAVWLGTVQHMNARCQVFHTAVTALRRQVMTIFIVLAAAHPVAAQDDPFSRLAEPQGEAWRIAESDILREWSRSGSPSMDLLLKRGEESLDLGDIPTAIGHLTALTDHAPDFAAGFQARADAYFEAGQFGPAIADLAHALEIEPRQFQALTRLGAMLEETGQDDRALAAYRQSLTIHPHQQEAIDGAARLERKALGTNI